MEQLFYIIAALALVLLNAFFVLAEFAIVKVRATRMRELAEKGNSNAILACSILKRLDAYLSTCQLGVTIASLGLGWVGEEAFSHTLEPFVSKSIAVAIAFCFVTLIHVVIGELVPKSISIRKPEGSALISARPLRFFYLVTYPAMWLLNASSNMILRIMRIAPPTEMESAHSEEELRMILGASHEKGAFTLNRLLMMENVLDFGTLQVKDVMVAAAKIVLLDPGAPWEQNFAVIKKSYHSRYPLGKAGAARYDFIVHIKDIAVAMTEGRAPDLQKIARSVQSVRPDLSLEDLLQHFHRNRSHLAMVEDDAGRFLGIVSLEDVVEELIGTVRDEFEQVKEFRLADIVAPEAIILTLDPVTKEQAIRALVQRLAQKRPEIQADAVVTAILKREQLISTGLGDGIAIPHGRINGLSRPWAAIGRAPTGIEFQSLDGKPATLLFLILTPVHDEGAHVHILGKISALLSSEYLRERLVHAPTVEEVMEVLRTSDQSLPA